MAPTLEDIKVSSNDGLSQIKTREDLLQRVQTADSVWLPRDVFETLYLNPERTVAGDLRKKFGNPTPAALIGFVISATPFSFANLGWRGAGGHGGAIITVMVFFGGMIQIIAAIGEWILGNTFSMCLFFTYGAFWTVAGAQMIPWFAVGAQYSMPIGDTFKGMEEPSYNATFAFYYVALAMLTTIFTICALRTNIVFVVVLFLLVATLCCAAGAFWSAAEGAVEHAKKLTLAVGALGITLTLMIWYILLVQLLEAVDFPITLPIGDLSNVIKGKKDRLRKKQAGN